jgi:hypothetical protein
VTKERLILIGIDQAENILVGGDQVETQRLILVGSDKERIILVGSDQAETYLNWK